MQYHVSESQTGGDKLTLRHTPKSGNAIFISTVTKDEAKDLAIELWDKATKSEPVQQETPFDEEVM